MGEISNAEQNNQSPKPRIVQYQNRRFSVRLEPVYWQALERLADRATMRLGQLIARLAAGYPGGNFSSFLARLLYAGGRAAPGAASDGA